MKKKVLEARVKNTKNETAEAMLVILNALNAGQKKKVRKDAKVAQLLERYGIEYAD